MTENIMFTKKQKITRGIIIAIVFVISLALLYIGLILNESRNIYITVSTSSSSTITYQTNYKQIYISEEINQILNKKNATLVISNQNYSVSILQNYTGFLTLPTVSVKNIDIYETTTLGIKISFWGTSPFSTFILNADVLPNSLANASLLDVYTNIAKNIQKASSLSTNDPLSIEPCDCYLVYIPAEDIAFDATNNIYKGANTKLNYTVTPQYATDSNIKFVDYDPNYLMVTENSELIGLQKGITNVTCVLDNISKNISVTILPTIERISVNKTTTQIELNNWSYAIATFAPNDAVNTELVWSSSDENVATVEDGMIKSHGIGTCTVTVSTKCEPYVSANISVKVVKRSTDYRYKQGEYGYPDTMIEGPYYVDGILIVNKKYSIPSNFASGINVEALAALREMQQEAAKKGLYLPNISDFRSYTTQKYLYQSYITESGMYYANTYSARPGHSEHSTGLAFDIGNINYAYGLTASGKWLSENCHKFGFILRYQKGKESLTGYSYEPWHIRYVGKENALKIYNSGLCLEEYLKLN